MAPDVSLEFIVDGRPLFTSTGKWLHPLFELERFLAERTRKARKSRTAPQALAVRSEKTYT